ncbi:MAG TPA: hypothetical protein VFV43_13525 [Limnobacter sp.]|nr:hypothetical protein [Limnobacter sp.]
MRWIFVVLIGLLLVFMVAGVVGVYFEIAQTDRGAAVQKFNAPLEIN